MLALPTAQGTGFLRDGFQSGVGVGAGEDGVRQAVARVTDGAGGRWGEGAPRRRGHKVREAVDGVVYVRGVVQLTVLRVVTVRRAVRLKRGKNYGRFKQVFCLTHFIPAPSAVHAIICITTVALGASTK